MDQRSLLALFFLLLFIIPVIFFLLTLQNTLKIISPENRKITPGNVWLILIPFLGIVWQFIVVGRIADSIKEECVKLNIPINENRPTYIIGLIYCISSILFLIPVIKTIGAFAGLILWILYWINVSKYKKLIEANKDKYLLDAEREIFHTQA